jgi:hypothetical protein
MWEEDKREGDRTLLAREDKPTPSPNYLKQKERRVCAAHDDEEVTYYCFLCMCGICPECAIHGDHQGHEVKAVKKAAPILKERILQFSEGIDTALSLLASLKESSVKKSRQVKE